MFSPELFKDQIALVTGAAGTIGKSVCDALHSSGAIVIAADVSYEGFKLIEDRYYQLQLNVREPNSIKQCFSLIQEQFLRLDILVNVAGVVSLGSAQSIEEDEWDRVLDINLKGTFLCCQSAIPVMKQNAYGRIINLGSVIGKNGGNPRPWLNPEEQDRASNLAYGVSKAGIGAITAFLAKELAASGITVNTVAPGPVASSMTRTFPQSLIDLIPVGRIGQAQDIASAILFLAAKQSSFITGETLDVNGGIWCD